VQYLETLNCPVPIDPEIAKKMKNAGHRAISAD